MITKRVVMTNCILMEQWRFPRSRKRRIQKKWRKDQRNWRAGQRAVVMLPESVMTQLRSIYGTGT